MKPTQAEDTAPYRKFTSRARLDKAIHTVEGIVRGVAADGKVSDQELKALAAWLADHREFMTFHPFTEIVPRLNYIIDNQIVDEEQVADVLWLCGKFTTTETYYDHVSSDMQRLQGILHGILADGAITKEELLNLEGWMEDREHLRKCWPYDEIESLIIAVLADGKIDESEHKMMLNFFREFCAGLDGNAVDPSVIGDTPKVSGVCAMCPEVKFTEKTFCFTGSSGLNTRAELASLVSELGGKHSKGLTKKVDYLVVCSEGNECWAYACYGRKVEKAITMRKNGENLLLIHETDFREALRDAE